MNINHLVLESYRTRSNIKPGSKVSIVLKKDQRTNKRVEGIVEKILSPGPVHTRGIKVRLTTGDIGRVQQILDDQPSNPDELFNYLSDIKYDRHTKEEDYIVKTPEEVLQTRKSICYDQVELERYFFERWKYQFKTFFIYGGLPIENNETHTVLIFKENNKYYWFEHSWEKFRSIQGPFDSYDSAVQKCCDELAKNWKINKIYYIEYNKPNKTHLNANQFANYIIHNSI